MAVFAGPEIVNNGLVFYYDSSNTQRSWKGASATNLAASNFFDGNDNFTIDENITDTMPDGSTGISRLLNAQFVSNPNRTVSIGSYALQAGQTYTLSFYVINIDCSGFNGNVYSPTLVRVIANITYPTVSTNTWTRVTTTFTVPNEGPNPVTVAPQAFRDGGNGRFKLCWLQLEQNTFATPYVNGARSNTQVIVDLTGINIITANNLSYASNNTFSFNGTSDFLRPSITHSYLNSSCLEVIFKKSSVTGRKFLFGYRHNDGYSAPTIGSMYFLDATLIGSLITANQVYRQVTSSQTIIANRYYHVCFNKDTVNGLMQIYVNGVLTGSQTFDAATYAQWPSAGQYIGADILDIGKSTNNASGQGWGTDFFDGDIPVSKVYNRVLTANEISQNFEAIRSKYGI